MLLKNLLSYCFLFLRSTASFVIESLKNIPKDDPGQMQNKCKRIRSAQRIHGAERDPRKCRVWGL